MCQNSEEIIKTLLSERLPKSNTNEVDETKLSSNQIFHFYTADVLVSHAVLRSYVHSTQLRKD